MVMLPAFMDHEKKLREIIAYCSAGNQYTLELESDEHAQVAWCLIHEIMAMVWQEGKQIPWLDAGWSIRWPGPGGVLRLESHWSRERNGGATYNLLTGEITKIPPQPRPLPRDCADFNLPVNLIARSLLEQLKNGQGFPGTQITFPCKTNVQAQQLWCALISEMKYQGGWPFVWADLQVDIYPAYWQIHTPTGIITISSQESPDHWARNPALMDCDNVASNTSGETTGS